MRLKGKPVYALVLAVLGACVFATTALAAPPNDMFASPQVLNGAQGSTTGTNVGATKEPGEPNHAGNIGGASVWYIWEAPFAGTVTISTFGSGFDTLLGVYTGGNLPTVTRVASSDDAEPPAGWSSVTFNTMTGRNYRIAVDGYNGGTGPSTGNITLSWNLNPSAPVPPNDNFSNARAISGFCSSTTGTNLAATKEPGEPNHAGNIGGASVWYVWTAEINGQTTITTEGSDFDTLLGVYTGSSVGSLTQVAANDDVNPPSDMTSSVTFNAIANTTYHIAVDGYFGPSHGLHEGTIALNWCETTPPPKCNQAVKVRWHFRLAGGPAGWSPIGTADCHTGSVTINFMTSPLRVLPGQTIEAGYALMLPNNTSTYVVAQMNLKATILVHCLVGFPSQNSFTVTMPDRGDSVGDGLWHPTADRNDPRGFQGSFVMPAFCPGGGTMVVGDGGGTFTGNFLLF